MLRKCSMHIGHNCRHHQRWRLMFNGKAISFSQRDRSTSPAGLFDWALPISVKNSVKASVLDHVAKQNDGHWINEKIEDDKTTERTVGGVNEPISSFYNDPLEEWHLDQHAKYWPGLPQNVLPYEQADPFLLAQDELDSLSTSIREDLLGMDHPVLNKAASYFFEDSASGKKVRPMIVLLLSRALADACTERGTDSVDIPLFTPPLAWQRKDLPRAQRRLAEISEIIHTASLFHDDVIDEAETRRGLPAVHTIFGSKVAILAGDYLLARASISLARLRNPEVIESMSLIIEHLVRGEIMQIRGSSGDQKRARLVHYLRKNFYKTASLMANSCKSVAILGSYPSEMVMASYEYGKHVGIAFQLVDDILDFEGNLSQLGKPALSDLKAGLSTAPVLFASSEFPELELLMDRKFKEDGDVERAVEYVFDSNGLRRTKELARVHAELAMEAALSLESSIYRDALVHLAHKVVSRTNQ
uniref:Trans-prenyltransferase 4 n=1 Tax=Haslea ostrearia TaxID=67476 RepID=A0A3G5BBX7_HASOS|nr:trans-prenyltransferase 4 [Haslea ostrearia]